MKVLVFQGRDQDGGKGGKDVRQGGDRKQNRTTRPWDVGSSVVPWGWMQGPKTPAVEIKQRKDSEWKPVTLLAKLPVVAWIFSAPSWSPGKCNFPWWLIVVKDYDHTGRFDPVLKLLFAESHWIKVPGYTRNSVHHLLEGEGGDIWDSVLSLFKLWYVGCLEPWQKTG